MLTYTSRTIVSFATLAQPNGPDYNIYAPDVFEGKLYLGGWRRPADIGLDKLYVSAPGADDPVELVWNGFNPNLLYHINDPSVVRTIDGKLSIFMTVLENGITGGAVQDYNMVAKATSSDNGASWTWTGIVIGQNNGFDFTAAWSPSALIKGDKIDVWYHTGQHDMNTGRALPTRVLMTEMNAAGTSINSTVQCIRTDTHQVLSAANVDVRQASDGTYWMVGNDFSSAGVYDLVAYESTDGINWTPWSGRGPLLIDNGTATLLTPTILNVDGNQLDMMYAEATAGQTIEHRVSIDFDTNAATNFQVASVFRGQETQSLAIAGDAYNGPVDYLRHEFIQITANNLNVIALSDSCFLRGGDGDDGLRARAGHNVLDGGMGSNFMTAGSGQDTFFTHAGGGADTWSTVTGFKPGDDITVWDVTLGVTSPQWIANQGAAGYQGATMHVTDGQGHAALLTLANYDIARAQGLGVTFGTTGGHTYMHLG